MEKKVLDYTLVPTGLLIMVLYHIWLLYWIVKRPSKTVIGVNAINRRFWVRAMMEDVSKNGVLAVQTLRNNIMASTLLASTAIMLSSLIAILMTSASGNRSAWFVYGDRSDLAFSIKFFSILVCFLVAFLLNVQSIRYYSHASILINVPFKNMSSRHHYHLLTAEYVARTVNRGSYFWSLGLRAFYFSFPLFLWIFGPIPMFLCCFFLVFMLYFLDVTFECGWAVGASDDHHKDEELGKDTSAKERIQIQYKDHVQHAAASTSYLRTAICNRVLSLGSLTSVLIVQDFISPNPWPWWWKHRYIDAY